MRATFLGYLHTRRQDTSTAGGRRKPKACSWLEQALAPRRSRRPAPLFQGTESWNISFINPGCGAATYEQERLAVEISSVQIKKKILLEKEDSKQEIRMKKGALLLNYVSGAKP